ncbi:MAG TPA: sulfite oxidase-like oxidoreductase [Rhizomicrobium sp.]|nr:sulfite oxidase-like oxidoreductase [Rhizomicrobium sp.]
MSETDDDKPELIGRVKDKLIRSKEEWADKGRALTGKADLRHARRLPPGQKLTQNWPVLDLGVQPDVKPEKWHLRVTGLVENALHWTLPEFMALPQQDFVSDIHCVTTWSRYDNHWQGVSARTILDLVKPKPDARHVIFHSYDGYTTNVKLDVFAEPDVLLAHSWEAKPIPREHGGPVRVVIPQWYFWKSAKWVNRIEFTAEDRPGFWEVRGYHNEGDPWKEERYS